MHCMTGESGLVDAMRESREKADRMVFLVHERNV